jgi:TRAP-type C4-dicarboxylate transport system permease small subunit
VFINWIDRIIKQPSVVFLKVGGWALAVMMVLTAGDVFMRNVFDKPILGTFEITQGLMVIVVVSGLAYVNVTKSQIRVEVLFSRLPQRAQVVLNIGSSFLSFGICVLLSWQSFVEMKAAYESGVIWGMLRVPTYPFVGLVGLGVMLLAVAVFSDFLESLRVVKK